MVLFCLSMFFVEPLRVFAGEPVVLNVASTANPQFHVDDAGCVWLTDFLGENLFRLDPKGRVILSRVNPMNGGPGEFTKPRSFVTFPHSQSLLVVSQYGQTDRFDFSGTFQQQLFRFLPNAGVIAWDAQREWMLYVFGGNQVARLGPEQHNMLVVDREGNLIESWFLEPEKLAEDRVPAGVAFSVTVDANRTLYMSSGGYREVRVAKPGAASSQVWTLAAPRFYRAPPARRLPEHEWVNKKKVMAHYQSFTQLSKLAVVNGHYLLVCWRLHKPWSHCLDVYDLRDRRRVVANYRLPGELIGAVGARFFAWSTQGSDRLDVEERHLLHVFSLGLAP